MKLNKILTSAIWFSPFLFALFFLTASYALEPHTKTSRTVFTNYPHPGHIGSSLEDRAKRPEYVAHPAGELVCRAFGACEPCPTDELDQPFCLPFGNRRLLHCLPASQAIDSESDGRAQVGEVPAWEACGKVISKERRDYWEFVTANLLFLIVALTILWARTSALATEQYRQLAARIGIPGGSWRI